MTTQRRRFGMTEQIVERLKAAPGSDEWMRVVNNTIAKAQGASREEQQAIFVWLYGKCGPEAVTKAKQVLGIPVVKNPMHERFMRRVADANKQQKSDDVLVSLKPQQQAKPEPEPEPEPEPKKDWKFGEDGGAAFSSETAKPDDDPVLLSKASPYDSAREYVRRRCFQNGVLVVFRWNGSFWKWNDCCYQKLSEDKVNADVWSFLDDARSRTQ